MSLPWIRQYPNGRRALAEFECKDGEVELLGKKFIALEGTYICEILSTGSVRLAACQFINGVQCDVEVEFSENGPPLAVAVEKLIRASVKHVEPQKIIPIRGGKREMERRVAKLAVVKPDGDAVN